MHALVSGIARMAARTLLARAGGVFMWPGIALTERRGAASVPIAADVARFWISRLHGPEANDWTVLRCLAIAAQKLSDGDEVGAQQALDASGLTRLSHDGAVLMRAVAGALAIGPLDLPWAQEPRLWRATASAFVDGSCAGGGDARQRGTTRLAIHLQRASSCMWDDQRSHGDMRLAPHAYLCERCAARHVSGRQSRSRRPYSPAT